MNGSNHFVTLLHTILWLHLVAPLVLYESKYSFFTKFAGSSRGE